MIHPRRVGAALGAQRGAGAIVAVVLLYVAMAIIVIFANRSLIFEQKTSANQYRATMALETAEAGIEWATTLLNKSGTISAACLDGGATSFRGRYLNYVSTTGLWGVLGASGRAVAACVTSQNGTDWTCNCPAAGTAPAITEPAGGGFKPSFAVAFETNTATRAVDLVSYGCTSGVTVSNAGAVTCAGDASATVRVTLANVAALATAPGAPLTARGQVDVGNAALGVQNGDPTTAGITVNAGMGVTAPSMRITSTPGTPPWTTVIGNDESLRNSTEDQMFQTFFGMPKTTWRDSVADAVLTCPCTETTVRDAYNAGKRKLWLQGNLSMNANITLGSVNDPFMMVVDGSIEMRGDLAIYAVMYSTAITWDNTGGGSALLVGAAISEGNYTGNGTPDYYYDPRVINTLTTIPGAFVRVPGTWRDFQ